MIDFLILSKRFVFISFWEQTFSLTELMSCFTEDTCRALQSIVGQSKELKLVQSIQEWTK